MKNSLLFLLFLLLSGAAKAQSTGSFDTSITFLGQPRQLSLYVPATYNAANKYRLIIGLHGLGDNSTNYRNALANARGWSTAYPNTIIVCPEAATTTSDYFMPAGNEAIIPASIAVAMNRYHIDTADVILQGFSLGGRAALRYALDNPAGFKGLLLNTPAVQGVLEALNGSAGYTYNYANAANLPPVLISHGGTDIFYTGAIDTVYEKLVINNSKVKLLRIASMGHDIPTTTQMDFLSHFNNPGNAPYDLDMVKLTVPDRTCSATVTPTCIIRNSGRNTLTSAKIHYVSGAVVGDYTWNGNLTAYQHAVVTLPVINATIGAQNLTVSITQLNNSLSDTVTVNNVATAGFTYAVSGLPMPVNEGFESTVFPPAGWFIHASGEEYAAYYRDDVVKKNGDASFGAFNTILIFNNAGRKEELLSPMIDLTSMPAPKLSFDVAYNYHHYTPPYFTADVDFADTLEVLVSTDCGASYQSVFRKGGKQLATFAAPILNPLRIEDCFAEPADSNWRREIVDLQPFATHNMAIIKFSYKSALGGSLNIDNVLFSNSSTSVKPVPANDLKVFPNPANDHVSIITGNTQVSQLDVVDVSGKLVKTMNFTNNSGRIDLDVTALSPGIYMMRLHTEAGISTRKLVISR